MKLNPNHPPLTQEQISEKKAWEHPWNAHMKKWDAEKEIEEKTKHKLKKPNPPTNADIEKAQFVDKTYHWTGQ